jgi:hypothetical protein
VSVIVIVRFIWSHSLSLFVRACHLHRCDHRRYIEKDGALARRFQTVFCSEPSVDTTISILRGVKDRYEVGGASVLVMISFVFSVVLLVSVLLCAVYVFSLHSALANLTINLQF